MSVSKRPNGRWRAQVETPAGQRAKIFVRKGDAQAWEGEQKAALRRGEFVDPVHGRITFAAFFDEWSKRQLWETGTQRAMSLAVRSVPFGDTPLAKIKRSHVEHWVKEMSSTLAPGTVTTRFNNVGTVFRGAVRDQVIGRNPTEGVKLPRQRRREHALILPTPEQVQAVLDASSDSFRTFVALAAFAGLRLGEAAAVQVGDIDFEAKRLHVARQVQRTNGHGVEIRAPKFGSERTIYLADQLTDMLADHVRLHVGTEGVQWLFRGQGDDPPHQNSIGYLWRKAAAKAGVEGVKLHDLRHFYASGLIAAGCDVVTVQRALGHARATTTLNTYSHLWPSAEDRTRQAANNLMSNVRTD
ncbi:tyrosine-type recombinase/integrase [Kocuria rosea]|uniref:tyrosine-type recombinase/integrase n=1 Tax=Kocuria rosea TaxID=1275 RepID=UPI0025406EFB|nr:site-specific integrase [Kocuria rosea]WIG18373.1 site-specific integrase [Kocuria rosea]